MSSVGTAEPRPGAYKALVLATLAFALCFAVWGLVAPLATRFQELYELSSTQISVVIATPVILGSLFRIPIGLLTDRFSGRDRQRLEEIEEQIRAHGGEALVVSVDLAKRHHPAHLVEAAVDAFGGLDALLFMACATAPPLESLDVDGWDRSLDVNVRGFIYCLAAALPAMYERGGGRVVVAGVEDTGARRTRSSAPGEPRCARSSRRVPAGSPPRASRPARSG
jgi:MFS family permease